MDQMLLSSLGISIDLNRYVSLVLDEVYVRDSLVYDKHNGQIVGFVDL